VAQKRATGLGVFIREKIRTKQHAGTLQPTLRGRVSRRHRRKLPQSLTKRWLLSDWLRRGFDSHDNFSIAKWLAIDG
jgi:hypothetical protein